MLRIRGMGDYLGKRAFQLGLLACLGAFVAWWLSSSDEDSAPPADRPAPRSTAPVDAAPPAAKPEPRQESRVEFRLPRVGVPEARASSLPADDPQSIQVPKNWLLRGSASKNYELRSDSVTAFSGNYSAVLSAHEKDIQPNLTGSAVQAVLAAPYVGTRVEISASLRSDGARPGAGSFWIYVTDPARVVIAYQIVPMSRELAQGQWQRYRIVMDVPWHGEVMAFGFSLQGKGKLWADDVKLLPVDDNVPVTGPQNSHQLGVIAQAVSLDGALANPNNLDFEDTLVSRERGPEAPPDAVRGTRF
jgi:hypothetical protein